MLFKELFQKSKDQFKGLKRIPLLKEIEKTSHKLFFQEFKDYQNVLGENNKELVLKAVLTQNFAGIKEFSTDFYKVLDICSKHQQLVREFIQLSLSELEHGFSDFDKTLIHHSCSISTFYDAFYQKWIQAVQGNDVSKLLEEKIQKKEEIPSGLLNPYTVIQMNEKKELFHTPYSQYFANELKPIIQEVDVLIQALKKVVSTKEQETYIPYLEQQKVCFEETQVDKLESQWEKLDSLWMDVQYPIQIVHDIESGYGDPTRTKIIPDFSIRFLDEMFSKENEEIEKIKKVMIKYFEKRDSTFSKNGIFALNNSSAGIFYIPFQTGMSFHFRFCGQSIPNNETVKNSKGVKIYFDNVSSEARIIESQNLVKKVFDNAETLNQKLNSITTIVYNVSAHEFGHAIYNLSCIESHISPATRSLLEEPRAELTTLTFIKELYDLKILDKEGMFNSILNFTLQDLRRFSKFDSSATRPYTISALSCYNLALKVGLFKFENEKVYVDQEKAYDFLSEQSKNFSHLLDLIDQKNGEEVEKFLSFLETESDFTKWIVRKLKI